MIAKLTGLLGFANLKVINFLFKLINNTLGIHLIYSVLNSLYHNISILSSEALNMILNP